MKPALVAEASKVIPDPNVLVNLVSRRVRQLSNGNRPLVDSPERLSYADVALMEIAQGKISYRKPETSEGQR